MNLVPPPLSDDEAYAGEREDEAYNEAYGEEEGGEAGYDRGGEGEGETRGVQLVNKLGHTLTPTDNFLLSSRTLPHMLQVR